MSLLLLEVARASRTVRVLVVDDEEAVRSALADLLDDEGFAVVGVAADGLEGARLALSLAPDAMVIDIRMPRLGGIDLIRRIRGELPGTRMVVLSAYDDKSLQLEARDAGADAFLVKGCPLGEIVGALGA